MTQQLAFFGAAFRVHPADRREEEQTTATRDAAHDAVEAAEAALLVEMSRPASREHWGRMATAYEQRASAWRLLAASASRDPFGHASRAMELASEADLLHARMLRGRLAVTG